MAAGGGGGAASSPKDVGHSAASRLRGDGGDGGTRLLEFSQHCPFVRTDLGEDLAIASFVNHGTFANGSSPSAEAKHNSSCANSSECSLFAQSLSILTASICLNIVTVLSETTERKGFSRDRC